MSGSFADGSFALAFCGTPEYIAPELLESQGYTKTVDWWTLGVLLYEMMVLWYSPALNPSKSFQTGLPPFYDENVNIMYQRILRDPLNFPLDILPEARAIMVGLLQRDPSRRLGANGAEEIKRHAFFSRYIDWNRYVYFCTYELGLQLCRLLAKKIQPPFKPSVVSKYLRTCSMSFTVKQQESVLDVANFDTDFTNEEAQDSVVTDSALSETVQDQFRGFTYNPTNEHLSESVSYPVVM